MFVYVVQDICDGDQACAVCGTLERAKQYIADEIRKIDLKDCDFTAEDFINSIDDNGVEDLYWIQKTEILQ